MKVLILLGVLGVACGQHWAPAAPVQDTAEVAAAKAAHYAALAREQSRQTNQGWNQNQNQWGQQNQWNGPPPQNQWNQQQEPIKKWYGPLALPPGFDRNGAPLPVQDTAEVAAERSKHFQLTGGFGAQAQPWTPAPAAPQWNQGSWNNNQGGWNQGHGRWRRSAVLAAAPLALSTVAVATPIVAAAPIVHAAPVLHAAPVIAAHW